MNELQVKMAQLHREIVDNNLLPFERLCVMDIDELNSYTEVTAYIVGQLGSENASLFAAQYLLGSGAKPSKVIEAVVVGNKLSEVTLTDSQFDEVEDNVRVVGVAGDGKLV